MIILNGDQSEEMKSVAIHIDYNYLQIGINGPILYYSASPESLELMRRMLKKYAKLSDSIPNN